MTSSPGGRPNFKQSLTVAARDEALLAYEQVVLTALEDVENALVAYAKEQAHGRLLQRAVAANQRAVELADQLYTKGPGNYLDLFDVQRSLYTTQDALVRSERAVTVNLIALYKTLGGGWEQGPPARLRFGSFNGYQSP